MKGLAWGTVVEICKEGLAGWIAASPAMTPDAVLGEIDFEPDQAVAPDRTGIERVAEYLAPTFPIGCADEDHRALQRALKIELPSPGEWPTSRRIFYADCGTKPVGRRKACRISLNILEVTEYESSPYRVLPTTIESFDVYVESLGQWRGENGNHTQGKIQTCHSTQFGATHCQNPACHRPGRNQARRHKSHATTVCNDFLRLITERVASVRFERLAGVVHAFGKTLTARSPRVYGLEAEDNVQTQPAVDEGEGQQEKAKRRAAPS